MQALLQAHFARTSNSRGWLNRSFLEEGQPEVLDTGIREYQVFLKLALMPNMPRIFPTAAVDLVWHTHQLLGIEYRFVLISECSF
jgi:hypothetical protein